MERRIAITFDDGPNPAITPLILEVLKEKDVKATFFLIGWLAEQYQGTVQQIVQAGHDVGNHTYTHPNLNELLATQGKDAVLEEINKGDKAVRLAAGFSKNRLIYFRPPGLNCDESVETILRPIYGQRIFKTGKCGNDFNWNGNNGNWSKDDARAINAKADEILRDVQQQESHNLVVALHDSSEYGVPGQRRRFDNWMGRAFPTLRALPDIIDYLREQSWTITTLDKLDLSAVD